MERMTKRTPDGTAYSKSLAPISEHMMMLVDRLAAYEDAGLEPEEVEQLKLFVMAKAVAEVEEFDGISIKRLRELAQAEKDGRLVVLAVNPYLKPAQTNEVFICENGGVWPIYVTGCEAGPNSEGRLAVIYETVDGDVFCDTDIGKTIFLTRQEAEEALRKEAENGRHREH